MQSNPDLPIKGRYHIFSNNSRLLLAGLRGGGETIREKKSATYTRFFSNSIRFH